MPNTKTMKVSSRYSVKSNQSSTIGAASKKRTTVHDSEAAQPFWSLREGQGDLLRRYEDDSVSESSSRSDSYTYDDDYDSLASSVASRSTYTTSSSYLSTYTESVTTRDETCASSVSTRSNVYDLNALKNYKPSWLFSRGTAEASEYDTVTSSLTGGHRTYGSEGDDDGVVTAPQLSREAKVERFTRNQTSTPPRLESITEGSVLSDSSLTRGASLVSLDSIKLFDPFGEYETTVERSPEAVLVESRDDDLASPRSERGRVSESVHAEESSLSLFLGALRGKPRIEDVVSSKNEATGTSAAQREGDADPSQLDGPEQERCENGKPAAEQPNDVSEFSEEEKLDVLAEEQRAAEMFKSRLGPGKVAASPRYKTQEAKPPSPRKRTTISSPRVKNENKGRGEEAEIGNKSTVNSNSKLELDDSAKQLKNSVLKREQHIVYRQAVINDDQVNPSPILKSKCPVNRRNGVPVDAMNPTSARDTTSIHNLLEIATTSHSHSFRDEKIEELDAFPTDPPKLNDETNYVKMNRMATWLPKDPPKVNNESQSYVKKSKKASKSKLAKLFSWRSKKAKKTRKASGETAAPIQSREPTSSPTPPSVKSSASVKSCTSGKTERSTMSGLTVKMGNLERSSKESDKSVTYISPTVETKEEPAHQETEPGLLDIASDFLLETATLNSDSFCAAEPEAEPEPTTQLVDQNADSADRTLSVGTLQDLQNAEDVTILEGTVSPEDNLPQDNSSNPKPLREDRSQKEKRPKNDLRKMVKIYKAKKLMSKNSDANLDARDEKKLLKAMDEAVKSRLSELEVKEADKEVEQPPQDYTGVGCGVFESLSYFGGWFRG